MSRFVAVAHDDYLTTSLNLAVADTRQPNLEAEKLACKLLEFASANPERANAKHLQSYMKALGMEGLTVKPKSPSVGFGASATH